MNSTETVQLYGEPARVSEAVRAESRMLGLNRGGASMSRKPEKEELQQTLGKMVTAQEKSMRTGL